MEEEVAEEEVEAEVTSEREVDMMTTREEDPATVTPAIPTTLAGPIALTTKTMRKDQRRKSSLGALETQDQLRPLIMMGPEEFQPLELKGTSQIARSRFAISQQRST